MYIYIYIYIYICIYMCVYIYIYIYTRVAYCRHPATKSTVGKQFCGTWQLSWRSKDVR